MKLIVIFILISFIVYLLFRINSIDNFQVPMMVPLFDIKSYIEKRECVPYEKRSVNCYKELLKEYIEDFKTKLSEIYSDELVEDTIANIEVDSSKCYDKLNEFPAKMVSKIINFSKDTSDINGKIEGLISKEEFFKESEIRFIQVYKAVQKSLEKYHKDKLFIVEIPDFPDNYIEDKEDCDTLKSFKKDKDVDVWGKQNIVKHFIKKLTDILDSIDIDTNKGTIEMYDADKLVSILKDSIIVSNEDDDSPEMKETSKRVMASLGVVSRTISDYYCGNRVNCCHKEDCEAIQKRIKNTNEENMVALYKKKYKKCIENNKNLQKESKICKKINLK